MATNKALFNDFKIALIGSGGASQRLSKSLVNLEGRMETYFRDIYDRNQQLKKPDASPDIKPGRTPKP